MATASDNLCLICLDTWDNPACNMPCLHRFCFSCIQRWAEIKPECPLCKRRVTSILHSLQGDKFEELPIEAPAALSGSAQDEGPHGLPEPTASRVQQPPNPYPVSVGGLYPSAWGQLFRRHPVLLQFLRPWLQQELGHIFGEEGSETLLLLEYMVLGALPAYGLHEEDLVQQLQADLQSHTTAFVQGLIAFAVEWCGRAAHCLLACDRGSQDSTRSATCSADFRRWREHSPVDRRGWAACQERQEGNLVTRTSSSGFQERGEGSLVTRISTSWATFPEAWQHSPFASTSPAASRPATPEPGPAPSGRAAAENAGELPGTSTAAVQEAAGCAPSIAACAPGEQEEQQQEPGQAAAGASAPSLGRACSHPGPRRPLKRKADSSATTKKPRKW